MCIEELTIYEKKTCSLEEEIHSLEANNNRSPVGQVVFQGSSLFETQNYLDQDTMSGHQSSAMKPNKTVTIAPPSQNINFHSQDEQIYEKEHSVITEQESHDEIVV